MVSALDSEISSSTFSDLKIAEHFSDEAEIRALILVERELAQVQESLGIIPSAVGKEIYSSLENLSIDSAALATGYKKDGIVIPALLVQLRANLSPIAADHLHFGATSQDILDTALILRIDSALSIIEGNLATLVGSLKELAKNHKSTLMIGRTRNQNAAPIVFGLKVVNWLAPLQRQRKRLHELKPRLLRVQLGGAVGTNAALGSKGIEVNRELANALGLEASASPWHAQRDSIVEFSNWLNLTSSAIAKMAQDIYLLAQSDIGEVSFSGIGKSSTMPNKSNPVPTENLLALAAYCQSQSTLMQQTVIADHERDGVAMATERLVFPPLVCAAGGSILQAIHCLEIMQVNQEKMKENFAANRGLLMAEAASFELATAMPKVEAAKLVSKACEQSLINKTDMLDELATLTDVNVDFQKLKQAENYLGSVSDIIDSAVNAD